MAWRETSPPFRFRCNPRGSVCLLEENAEILEDEEDGDGEEQDDDGPLTLVLVPACVATLIIVVNAVIILLFLFLRTAVLRVSEVDGSILKIFSCASNLLPHTRRRRQTLRKTLSSTSAI